MYLCSGKIFIERMKKGIIASAFLGGLLLAASCHRQTFEDSVAQEVENFNKNEAPKRQDPVSVFDSMNFDRQSLTISYFYTVEGEGETLFPAELLKESVLKTLRSSIQLKEHKERGYNFRYVYNAKSDGHTLMDVTFTKKEYK